MSVTRNDGTRRAGRRASGAIGSSYVNGIGLTVDGGRPLPSPARYAYRGSDASRLPERATTPQRGLTRNRVTSDIDARCHAAVGVGATGPAASSKFGVGRWRRCFEQNAAD